VHAALERLSACGRPAGAPLLQLLLGEPGQHRQQQAAARLDAVDAVLDGDQPPARLLDPLDRLQRLQRPAAEAAQLVGDDPRRGARLNPAEQPAQRALVPEDQLTIVKLPDEYRIELIERSGG